MAEERPRVGGSIPPLQGSPDWIPPKPARTPAPPARDSEPYIATTVMPLDELPAPNPYAVLDNEQTLLDHRPPSEAKLDTPRMVPVGAMVAEARTNESQPPPSARVWKDMRGVVDRRLVLLNEPESARSASYRLLRDNILERGSPRIIAVASGAPNEGKTTCAINLALALSERPGARVLLLDGNFFAPGLGEVFHVDASTPPARGMDLPWLEPYRIAEIAPGFQVAALLRTSTGGPPPFNSRWFHMALDHLAGAGHDFLVIDAAALDGNAIMLQVIGAADGTLLTARSKGSTARTFRKAADQIPKGRALGVTLIEG